MWSMLCLQMFFEKEVNSPLRNVLERQPTKKRAQCV